MGMSIDAMLIYGVPYTDIPEELIEQVDEMLDEGTLDYASPWYDCSREDWIVGIEVYARGHAASEIYNYCKIIEEEYEAFKVLSNHPGIPFMTLWVSPHVT